MTVLTTARLRLRPHRPADHDALHALWSDPAVHRFIGGRAPTREESWGRLLRYAGHWSLAGYGLFAVEEAASGRLVGDCGAAAFRRGHGPRFDGAPEMGWVFASDVHGRGLAHEAAGAVLDWLCARGMGRTVCLVDAANAASRRLATRLGYAAFGEATQGGTHALLFERQPSADPRASQGS